MAVTTNRNEGFRTRPPFKGIFQIAAIAETFFITLPATLAYFTIRPSSRPHPKWPLLRSVFISVFKSFRTRTRPLKLRTGCIDKRSMPKLRADADATALWIPPINPDTDLEGDLQSMFQAGKCTVLDRNLVYWYGKDHNKVDRKAEKAEKVILYLHGGGYYEQNASPSNPTTNCLRILLSASAKSKNETAPKRALNVEYRLSDDTSFPGILSDALAAWKYLIDQGFEPKNILIAGDSAGANLTLALVRYLIQHRPFYPNWKKEDKVADGIVLYSPWVDLTLSFSQKASRNEGTDYLNPKLFAKAIEPLLEGLPKGAASNLLISCVSKDRKVTEDVFDGFPRALIFGGSLEVLIDEIRALQHNLNISAKAGRCESVTYHEEPLAAHDWCALPYGFSEEQQRTMQRITQWI